MRLASFVCSRSASPVGFGRTTADRKAPPWMRASWRESSLKIEDEGGRPAEQSRSEGATLAGATKKDGRSACTWESADCGRISFYVAHTRAPRDTRERPAGRTRPPARHKTAKKGLFREKV